ncbi:MAG TPA: hypothetical protein VFH71_10320, partial [Rhodanobacteraceae bacterium]|nr:hypothetical protein [Rhodanobacteraceae bacterium]
RARLRENIELLHALAGSIADLASAECPELDVSALRAAAGERERPALFVPMRGGLPASAHSAIHANYLAVDV